MLGSRKGEIATIFTIGSLIILSVATIISSLALKKTYTYKSKAAGRCFFLSADVYAEQVNNGWRFKTAVKVNSPEGGGDGHIQFFINGASQGTIWPWNKGVNNPFVIIDQYTQPQTLANGENRVMDYAVKVDECNERGNYETLPCTFAVDADGNPDVTGDNCNFKNPPAPPAQKTYENCVYSEMGSNGPVCYSGKCEVVAGQTCGFNNRCLYDPATSEEVPCPGQPEPSDTPVPKSAGRGTCVYSQIVNDKPVCYSGVCKNEGDYSCTFNTNCVYDEWTGSSKKLDNCSGTKLSPLCAGPTLCKNLGGNNKYFFFDDNKAYYENVENGICDVNRKIGNYDDVKKYCGISSSQSSCKLYKTCSDGKKYSVKDGFYYNNEECSGQSIGKNPPSCGAKEEKDYTSKGTIIIKPSKIIVPEGADMHQVLKLLFAQYNAYQYDDCTSTKKTSFKEIKGEAPFGGDMFTFKSVPRFYPDKKGNTCSAQYNISVFYKSRSNNILGYFKTNEGMDLKSFSFNAKEDLTKEIVWDEVDLKPYIQSFFIGVLNSRKDSSVNINKVKVYFDNDSLDIDTDLKNILYNNTIAPVLSPTYMFYGYSKKPTKIIIEDGYSEDGTGIYKLPKNEWPSAGGNFLLKIQ